MALNFHLGATVLGPMEARSIIMAIALFAIVSAAACRSAQPVSAQPPRVAHLCVTAGRIETLGPGRFRVDVGGMRGSAAVDATDMKRDAAELTFTYRGPSATTVPLASGEPRRQIGLKLRAQDTCNVVYVMWHLEPSAGIFVSVKRNPGASTHGECGDKGYLNLQPRSVSAAAPVHVGEVHTLRAELRGDLLTVWADGPLVWEAPLPSVAREIAGPVGIRSDNGAFDFELRVAGAASTALDCAGP